MKKFILVLVLCCICSCSFASTDKQPIIYILHINGVNTLPYEAENNLRMLQDVSKIRSNVITWGVLYNPTHGSLARDLSDVYRQKKTRK